ncbi:DNA methyltransferase [Vagococcus fluvialis]|uniref:DNA methyltransferase n=1 Tax=Vagococcus fluvialis TaxID=2738 RepID=UPI003B21930F
MAETVLLKEIKQVLSRFTQYWNNEILLKNMVSEDLRNYEPELITALLSNESIKKQFEITINDTSIFKIEEFIQMLTYKDFWEDSYTKYSNKIGLTANGKYLDYNSDVVLDFPFKDCILEGGMTKEEVGKKEVYYNKVIARDEVDTLLAPKVFTNTKKYTKDGEESVSDITDTDNLIIKGNNLLALHSLKERYAGKVKAIFIDPPYYFVDTKPADTFAYNSNFKLSSWLVFMRNRLEIARDILSKEGIIYITISDEGAHYLKVLCDSIFGYDNFIADITWQSRKSVSSDGLISVSSNHILTYSKNRTKINKRTFKLALDVDGFNLIDDNGKFKVEPFDAPHKRQNLEYKIVNPETSQEFYPPEGRHWRTTEKEYQRLLSEGKIRFGASGDSKPQLKVYLDDAIEEGKGKTATTIWNDIHTDSIIWSETDTTTNGTKHQQKLFGHVVFENPKPEGLLQRALELSTNENDIVLDFFMGSATTQAVAMKMNRQFIGIEQMDYINTVSVPRLQKVMEGEQGGISKDVNWQGGGSFIYTELMDLNNTYIKQIKEAKTSTELLDILETIKKYADLNYLVELEKLTNEPIIIDEDTKETLSFEEISLDKQRELLIDVMDINQLYVNYSEIDDAMYEVSEQDKAFNRSFYEEGDN